MQELDGGSPPNVTANLLTGRGIDEYFTRTDSTGTRDFLADMLGSTIALADSSGTLQTQYSYDPFGNATVSGGSSANPYQFTGRENDSTGLYYYRARYYSPTFQRFVAQDPLDFAGGDFNLYPYVLDNPANGTDPSGRGPFSCIKFFIDLMEFNSALNQCKQQYQNCDPNNLWDDNSLACRQDYCTQHGAPSDPVTAMKNCACALVGADVCINIFSPVGAGQACGL